MRAALVSMGLAILVLPAASRMPQDVLTLTTTAAKVAKRATSITGFRGASTMGTSSTLARPRITMARPRAASHGAKGPRSHTRS